MTMVFIDGFDHYATADIASKWGSINGAPTISASGGRRSGGCLVAAAANRWAQKTVTAGASWVFGFAFKIDTSLPASNGSILQLTDAGSNQVCLTLSSDGTLTIKRGGSGGTAVTGGTSSNAISTGVWYYIEWKVTIADSIGANTCQVNVNGSQWINVTTGQDTKATANATINGFQLGSGGTLTGTCNYDDFYCFDQSGSTNNDFVGDRRVDAYYPNGNGNSSQMTGSDGNSTDNYLLVDETAPNGDTDYVQSSNSGDKDTYAMQDMSHTPTTINGVQVSMYAKKDDAGTRSISSVIRSGGSDTNGTTQGLSTSYTYYFQVQETDPNTAAAWTKTNFNAAEFGHRVAA